MGIISKFKNKFMARFKKKTSKAEDGIVDKVIGKIFGDDKKKTTTTSTQQVNVNTNTAPAQQMLDPQRNYEADRVDFPEATNEDEAPAAAPNLSGVNAKDLSNVFGMAMMGMSSANDILKYLKFNDDMEVIGVTDDAPDFLKIAYKKGALNNNKNNND